MGSIMGDLERNSSANPHDHVQHAELSNARPEHTKQEAQDVQVCGAACEPCHARRYNPPAQGEETDPPICPHSLSYKL